MECARARSFTAADDNTRRCRVKREKKVRHLKAGQPTECSNDNDKQTRPENETPADRNKGSQQDTQQNNNKSGNRSRIVLPLLDAFRQEQRPELYRAEMRPINSAVCACRAGFSGKQECSNIYGHNRVVVPTLNSTCFSHCYIVVVERGALRDFSRSLPLLFISFCSFCLFSGVSTAGLGQYV